MKTKYDKKLSIYLNDELKERLDSIGRREGTKLSATVRWLTIRAIKLYEKGELK